MDLVTIRQNYYFLIPCGTQESFEEDPEGYARDYETNLRDQVIYRNGLDKLRVVVADKLGKQPGQVTNDDIKVK